MSEHKQETWLGSIQQGCRLMRNQCQCNWRYEVGCARCSSLSILAMHFINETSLDLLQELCLGGADQLEQTNRTATWGIKTARYQKIGSISGKVTSWPCWSCMLWKKLWTAGERKWQGTLPLTDNPMACWSTYKELRKCENSESEPGNLCLFLLFFTSSPSSLDLPPVDARYYRMDSQVTQSPIDWSQQLLEGHRRRNSDKVELYTEVNLLQGGRSPIRTGRACTYDYILRTILVGCMTSPSSDQ
jgi:hypothetical protein